MAVPMSTETRTLLRMLGDGEWHEYERIMSALIPYVAPGKALRRYQATEAARIRRFGARKNPPLTEDEQIASGRRSIAADAINSLKKRYIEIHTDELTQFRRIRRRAQIVPIADPLARKLDLNDAEQRTEESGEDDGERAPLDSPAEQPTSDRPAAEMLQALSGVDEDWLRDLVADEVGRVVEMVVGYALDNFQYGLQVWLSHQFANLERPRAYPPPGKSERRMDEQLPRALRRHRGKGGGGRNNS